MEVLIKQDQNSRFTIKDQFDTLMKMRHLVIQIQDMQFVSKMISETKEQLNLNVGKYKKSSYTNFTKSAREANLRL